MLLEGAGYLLEIDPSGFEEPDPASGTVPADYAAHLAWRKAAVVAARRKSGLILGADTVCDVNGAILNKPLDRADAERMIRLQEGHETEVISGICLFRVLQESMHNAVKHSGVRRIEVQLREESGEIHLTIRDLGKGFDVDAAQQGRGLGLTSMQERVRLVNGTIAIDSKPMGGTTIHVRVPLEFQQASQRNAG